MYKDQTSTAVKLQIPIGDKSLCNPVDWNDNHIANNTHSTMYFRLAAKEELKFAT